MAELTQLNDSVDVIVAGQGAIGLQVSGTTFDATVDFQASVDNVSFYPALFYPANSGTAVTNTTTENVFVANVAGYTSVRAIVSTCATDTDPVVVTWRVSANPR